MFVIHDEDGAVFQINHGGIGADEVIDQDRVAPGLAFVEAVVEARLGQAMGENEDVVHRAVQIGGVAGEAIGGGNAPGLAAVLRFGPGHGVAAAALCRVEGAVFQLDEVCFRIEGHAVVVDVGDRAPGHAVIIGEDDRTMAQAVGFPVESQGQTAIGELADGRAAIVIGRNQPGLRPGLAEVIGVYRPGAEALKRRTIAGVGGQ